MKLFQKLITQDTELNRIQDQITEVLNPVVKKILLDGELVQSIELSSSGDNFVNHKLNRNYTGWIITRKSANANVYESTTTNKFTDKQIILNASAAVTVDIWFF